MALVQSNVAAENKYATALQMLRGALMDELSATNLYESLAKEIPRYADILNEIKLDEINHQGRLLQIIMEIDPFQLEKFRAGMEQEE